MRAGAGAAYLCSGVTWPPIPGDAVHFTGFAFGMRPHGAVQLSSGESMCNNTSGIEAAEGREKKATAVAFFRERKNAQKFDLSGSDAEDFHRLPFT